MRLLICAIVLGISLLGLGGIGAAIANDVLLPDNNGSSPAAPSLGLSPQPDTSASPAGSQGKPAPSSILSSPQQPVSAATPQPLTEEENAQISASDKALSAIPKQSLPAQGGILSMQGAALPATPTQVINRPVDDNSNTRPSSNAPYSMDISIMDKYVFGNIDTAAIFASLGLSPAQVSQNCRLSLEGMLIGGTFESFDMSPSSTTTSVGYAGNPASILVDYKALCSAPNLPANAGVIVKYGDKYIVGLGQTSCSMPNRPAKMLFKYAGNGQAQCIFK